MQQVTTLRAQPDLSGLVEEFNRAHALAEQHCRGAVIQAIRCGELLFEAKQLCGHGSWEQWLADNVSVSPRTARLYMQLARLPAEKRQRVADLPLRESLSAIRQRERRIREAAERRIREAAAVAAPCLPARTPPAPEPASDKVWPTPDEIADELIDQLLLAALEEAVDIDTLRAAFERRLGGPDRPPH
jgi:hypothetical protein